MLKALCRVVSPLCHVPLLTAERHCRDAGSATSPSPLLAATALFWRKDGPLCAVPLTLNGNRRDEMERGEKNDLTSQKTQFLRGKRQLLGVDRELTLPVGHRAAVAKACGRDLGSFVQVLELRGFGRCCCRPRHLEEQLCSTSN